MKSSTRVKPNMKQDVKDLEHMMVKAAIPTQLVLIIKAAAVNLGLHEELRSEVVRVLPAYRRTGDVRLFVKAADTAMGEEWETRGFESDSQKNRDLYATVAEVVASLRL